MSWPQDADGDVFRRLDAEGFDFSRAVEIDFFIDFETTPPPDAALAAISEAYPTAEFEMHDDEDYIIVQLQAKLTYSLATSTQEKLTQLTSGYGGSCESWGVFQEPEDVARQ